jgi:hypothetical protein
MRDNRIRPIVKARITLLIPRVNIWQAEIAAVRFDVERGYHEMVARIIGAPTECWRCSRTAGLRIG